MTDPLPEKLILGRAGRSSAQAGVPAWRRRTRGEHRWPAAMAVLAVVGLQLTLPHPLVFRPSWLLPAVELVLFGLLVAANPTRVDRESRILRMLGITLVIAVTIATAWSAVLVVRELVAGDSVAGAQILTAGGVIWLTNVLVFALWYWEYDRGGPAARAHARRDRPDFVFSGMTMPELAGPDWEPRFVDYLYLSFTNAAAFSPTDTLPLSRWAKMAMLGQAAVSLVTVALIVSRAVNVLGP